MCVIHNMSENAVCAQLISFVMKYDKKELNLEVIDDFQTDYLDKKAINDYKKSKTPNRAKTNRMNANTSINLLMNQINEAKQPKLTTKVV